MNEIAVVGVGCVVPGALSAKDFWANLLAGRTSLSTVPPSAWDHSLYYDPDRTVPDRTYARLGGFVSGFNLDWRRLKIPPADAAAVNPMQWMVLEAGCQAVQGVNAIPSETSAVIIGSTGLGWQKDSGLRIRLDDMVDAVRESEALRQLDKTQQAAVLEAARRSLSARLKEVSEDNVVGASASVAAGRLNMQFDFKGPHAAIDAGFASSLAALDLAVRGLRDREYDFVVTGGVSEMLTPLELIAFSKLGALSPTQVRPFEETADGTLLGEGASLFALKRLDDAVAAKDTIYAVIRGVGGSSDGRGKSLVAPLAAGQALAMKRAFDDAGPSFDARSVGFVECHASGTQVGDASEVRALSQVYAEAERGSVALGSVKANIGHLRSGAGAAGLLKAVLSLHHRRIPPQPNFGTVSPAFELERTPFFVARAESAYPSGRIPRASVSAFSFGGNNFHALLQAYEPETSPAPARAPRARTAEPVAIIGLGGVFPGADSVPQFWDRLLEGYDRTSPVPADRYAIERYFAPGSERKDKSYTNLGCFLDSLPKPTAAMRIPPSAWQAIDPSHILCLLSAEEALRDASFRPDRWDLNRVSVSLAFLPYQGKKFLADSRVNWAEFSVELAAALDASNLSQAQRRAVLLEAERRYKQALPDITEDTLTGYLGSLNAGRIASLYDFHGPHFVVDAACASTHAAVHAGVKLLSHRQADVVLSGGVWCDMRPEFFIAACRFNALSARGSFPFDASADGFIPGEGAGVMVLKRLADAERDGDTIRAVLRSVEGSSDGRGRSVLAPSRSGEHLALTRALRVAHIAPSSVDYVECHGTGTALGDVVEAQAIGDAYGANRKKPIAIGSAKSNIGHLNAAAGVAGLFKATLAVQKGAIPPSIKCGVKNPKIPESVEVVTQRRDWTSGEDGGPRRAGVSAFGVGGANFHALVEEYRGKTTSSAQPSNSEVLAFVGASASMALEQLERHVEQAASGQRGFAQLANPTPAEGGFRLALTARSADDAGKKAALLRQVLRTGGDLGFLAQQGIFASPANGSLQRAKVAVSFPGQGGQYANMLRAVAQAYPTVQATLDEADRVYETLTGHSLSSTFFTESPEQFRQTDADIHPAVFVVNVALHRLMESFGIRAEFLIGQSAGELAALVVAEAMSFSDGLRAIHARTAAVLALTPPDPGSMLALGCSAAQAKDLVAGIPGYAALAADNGPKASIVSADRPAAEALIRRCAEKAIECTRLDVSHGYHSQLIADARGPYRQALERLTLRAPTRTVISTIDARPYAGLPPGGLPSFLASQFVEPVRLRDALLTAHQLGARIFLEAGPKWSLTQFTRETLGVLPHVAVASIHPKVGELEQLGRLRASCFVHEVGGLAAPDSSPRMTTSIVSSVSTSQAVLELPLQPVLEPGTAAKIAAALGAKFGVETRDIGAEALSTLGSIVAWVEQRLEQRAAVPAPPPEKVIAMPPSDAKSLREEVARVLMQNMVAKTGYPAEMLGEDLDLEADLGIDTVKQVDIFAKTREHFGVVRDPKMSLRDFNTLRKVTDHLVERLEREGKRVPATAPRAAPPTAAAVPPAPRAAPAVSSADLEKLLLANTIERTGYPAEMLGLDLDLEADLGIDTVKQVEVFSKTREQLGIPRDAAFVLRDYNTLRKYLAYLAQRLPSAPAAPVAAPVRAAASPAPSSVQGALMSMDLTRELGLSEVEKSRFAKALATHLGVSSPELGQVSTLDDLVRAIEARSKR